MFKKIALLGVATSLLLSACASNKVKDAASDPIAAKAAAHAKPGSVGPGTEGAPILVGPDIIMAVPVEVAWKTLSDVENWGLWNKKVTSVQPGAGLNVGTELHWTWEEKQIMSTVLELKENELLVLKGCRSGSNVSLRWSLRMVDPQHSGISLRAVLKSGASQTLIANAGLETQAWINAIQDELLKKVVTTAPPQKTKKTHKKAL